MTTLKFLSILLSQQKLTDQQLNFFKIKLFCELCPRNYSLKQEAPVLTNGQLHTEMNQFIQREFIELL